MTVIQEIFKWATEQPIWQQDTIARLYAERELGAEDLDDIYSLLKVEYGIPDPQNRIACTLPPIRPDTPQTPGQKIQLTAIKDLKKVNAIAEDECIPISASGLSVIYGDNGAGKSGYSRVLKKACRARDQREPILPNANVKAGKTSPAQAKFELLVDGNQADLNWIDGQTAPEELSAIAIFDSHCARAYLDNHGDFAYSPYGLDILEGLVATCGKLRSMATKEKTENKPNLIPLAALSQTTTKVGTLLSALSNDTDPKDVEKLATLTQTEKDRLETLAKTLAESDPRQMAQVLRLRATRFGSVANRIENATAVVDQAKVDNLHTLVDKSNTAKDTATIAASEFKGIAGFLPGTGGEAWKELFEAARAFSLESHSNKTFPDLGTESPCPLCQNRLSDAGSSRLIAFESFIQQKVETAAKLARDTAATAYRAIDQAKLDLNIDETLHAEIKTWNSEIADTCAAMQKGLQVRQQAICNAAGSKLPWEKIPALPTDPQADLTSAETEMKSQAKTLEEALNKKTRAAMQAEHSELAARLRLTEIKSVVLEMISKMVKIEKLQCCIDATATTKISRKSTELVRTMATPEVAKALNSELVALNVHELCITMKNVSTLGKTHFKLVLEFPGGGTPTQILSEGEQRAIAIASFLAEINLGDNTGGIVFDDPVSSLDHRRRWGVAKRLAFEAKKRQVIIFTHDVYFLCILQQEADSNNVDCLTQSVRKSPKGFGTRSDRLPFDTLSTSKRVKALRNMHTLAVKAHKAGDDESTRRLTQDAYFYLRTAWERGVEEVLFSGVVTRFTEGISTQRLRSVVVEDSDYRSIDAGMTKSSKFAHDAAAAAQLPTPHPDELSVDIEALETWRSEVVGRYKSVEANRK